MIVAQFDLYRNPSVAQRAAIPYFVDVQSDLLRGLPTRLTLPLAVPARAPDVAPRNLCPILEVEGQVVRVLPHLAAAFRPRDLGKPVGSLAGRSAELVAALDAVISGV